MLLISQSARVLANHKGKVRGYMYRARSAAFGARRTTSGAFGTGLRHFLHCHRPPTPGLDDAAESRCRKLRQKDHPSTGMTEKLDLIPRLPPQILTDSLQNLRLTLDRPH